MNVAEFGKDTAEAGDTIFDNVYPRSIYQNRQRLDEVVITGSLAWLERGEEPDVFVLTEMDPYFREYYSFKDYAENNHFSKIYATERSSVFIKG